tara:strand:- start:3675 stop:4178 length:504 start_codon:yes stop_codon:yes gene_type:complete
MQKLTREEKIVLEIQNNPGIRFRELMKMVGITNGIMSYYIQKLEKIGIIFVHRQAGIARLFTNDINSSEINLIQYLRTPTTKKIMVSLLAEDHLKFKQITETIQMSPSTTSFYLKKLVSSKIVNVSGSFPKVYSLLMKEKISNLIVLYHPDIVDSASTNLADIFSAY